MRGSRPLGSDSATYVIAALAVETGISPIDLLAAGDQMISEMLGYMKERAEKRRRAR